MIEVDEFVMSGSVTADGDETPNELVRRLLLWADAHGYILAGVRMSFEDARQRTVKFRVVRQADRQSAWEASQPVLEGLTT